MKRIFFALVTTFCIATAFPQKGPEGLGPFKIEKTTTEDFMAYAKESNANVVVIDDISDYAKMDDARNLRYVEFRRNSKTSYKSPPEASYCDSCRVMKIPRLEISGVSIQNLKFKFLNGVLEELECDYDQSVIDALTVKYGSPKKEVEKDSTKCIYNLTGLTETKVSSTFMNSWKNGKINCIAMTGDYYDLKCVRQFISKISFHGSKSSEIMDCELDGMRGPKKPLPNKETLKDF